MPHSLVLNIIPQSPIYPGYLSGKHIHALFLTLVSAVDKLLGDFLHADKSNKAFTLSPLQVSSNYRVQWEHKQAIAPGTPCWLRISLLDEALFSKLTQLWLNLNPSRAWHLGSADLKITSVLGTPQSTQPWANFCSYSQLYEQASDRDRLISFTLSTPTAFRQQEFDCALPSRDSVFNSLINRWHKFSKIEMSPDIVQAIFPSYFDIRTEIVADSRSKFIGCVGNVSYRILGNVEPQVIKQINALADFALYSGVGRKTPMGMGMVRRSQIRKPT
ncbi:CRISPR-associated endoribonuclease Cas6 [Aliterella atlantica]|uniref:CRISPR-associated protein Cas6 n=1 Tax=Aliterella atlantica CENA595 TaxID=1618023 RepID=A0A0D8ZLD9_9CYAN|nr:CRISPR-associated endoribonuclease Cas6 [Aliterella atlantica]KJH69555.1 CRISPR-associated protein Cas6 [Aliterella atlantica CENA595]